MHFWFLSFSCQIKNCSFFFPLLQKNMSLIVAVKKEEERCETFTLNISRFLFHLKMEWIKSQYYFQMRKFTRGVSNIPSPALQKSIHEKFIPRRFLLFTFLYIRISADYGCENVVNDCICLFAKISLQFEFKFLFFLFLFPT